MTMPLQSFSALPFRRVRVAWLCLLALAWFGPRAVADVIIFTDGTIMEGTVEDVDEERVRIIRADGFIERRRADIAAVEPDRTVAERLILGDHALRGDPPDFEVAYRQFMLAERQDPNNPEAILGMGRALLGEGDLPAARARVLQGVLIHGEHLRLRVFQAELMAWAGEYEGALQRLDDIRAMLPSAEIQYAIRQVLDLIEELRGNPEPELPGAAPLPEWNGDLGDCPEAVERALALLAWAREEGPDIFVSGQLQARPQGTLRTLEGLRQRGDTDQYFQAVPNVLWRPRVDMAAWNRASSGTDSRARRFREITLYGWYYQLRRAYPRATIVIELLGQDPRRGSDIQIARVTYNNGLEQIQIDWRTS